MTSGEIYEQNKKVYNREADSYINEFLSKDGNMAHRPFEMMTHYTRMIVERISENTFIGYTAYVKDIEYSEHRIIKKYTGKKDDAIIYDRLRLIKLFGFEISLNPHSKSNRSIELNAL